MQNLRAMKYLSELEIVSNSNLITQHPKSTLADVRETKRVLKAIPHFQKLSLSRFELDAGSPIFESLDPDSRELVGPLSIE